MAISQALSRPRSGSISIHERNAIGDQVQGASRHHLQQQDQPGRPVTKMTKILTKKILNQDCCLALSGQERNQELHCNNHHPFDVTTIVRHNQLGLIHLGPPSRSNLGPQPFFVCQQSILRDGPLTFMYNYEHTAKINAFVENFEIPE